MIRQDIDIAALRKAQNLSQAQLAERVGVSQATISRLEKGEHDPSLQFLVKVARALDLELRDLLLEETLREVLGQETREKFYAFCPNPLCDKNTFDRRDGNFSVSWQSGDFYPVKRYNEVNFCTRCGTDMVKECPSCGRLLEDRGSQFCISCGHSITDRPTDQEWLKIGEILDKRDAEDDIPF